MIENKIKRILVPMDGSKNSLRALENAIELARAYHATIVGVSIISFLPAEFVPAVVPYRISQKKKKQASSWKRQKPLPQKKKEFYSNM